MADFEQESRLRLTAVDETQAVFDAVGNRINQFSGEAQRQTGEASSGLSQLNDTISQVKQALAVLGAGAMLRESLTQFADLQERITRIGNAAHATLQATEDITPRVQEIANKLHAPFEQVLSGVETLVLDGNKSIDQAIAMVPELAKVARDSNANIQTVAAGAVSTMEQLKVPQGEINESYNIMLRASGQGRTNFESLIDMMPRLGAAAHAAGLNGNEGLKQVVAMEELIRSGAMSDGAALKGTQSILEGMYSDKVAKAFGDVGVDIRKVLDDAKATGQNVPLVFANAVKENFNTEDLVKLFGPQMGRALEQLIQEDEKGLSRLDGIVKGIDADTRTVESDFNRFTSNAKDGLNDAFNAMHDLKQSVGEFMNDAHIPAWIHTSAEGINAITASVQGWATLFDAPAQAVENMKRNAEEILHLLPGFGRAGIVEPTRHLPYGGKSLEERDAALQERVDRALGAASGGGGMNMPGASGTLEERERINMLRQHLADLNKELDHAREQLAAETNPFVQRDLQRREQALQAAVDKLTADLAELDAGIKRMSFDSGGGFQSQPQPRYASYETYGETYGTHDDPRIINASYSPGNGSVMRYDPRPVGMIEPGNIDLHTRPIVKNADGSFSTVRSISINEDGKEVLIPTISPSGQQLTMAGALALYRRTGKNLGVFDSAEAADAYAQSLHGDQAAEYGGAAGGGEDRVGGGFGGRVPRDVATSGLDSGKRGRGGGGGRAGSTMGGNVDSWMKFLTGEMGLTRAQAAGVVGALRGESGKSLNPGAINPDSGAYGVDQWLGPRKRALFAFASAHGLDPSETRTQQLFFKAEAEGTLPASYHDDESRNWNAVKRSTSPEAATATMTRRFIRPSDAEYASSIGTRTDFGRRVYAGSEAAGPAPVAEDRDTRASRDLTAMVDAHRAARSEMEAPIRMKVEAPTPPSTIAPQMRRQTGRRMLSRDMRETRGDSFSDLGAA